jgi:hypothetical protein
MKRVALVFLIVACSTPVASSPPPSCPAVVIRGVLADLTTASRGWDDAEKVARSTPRVALASQVQRLQEIRNRVSLVTVSPCTLGARTATIEWMDATIDYFLAFMRNDARADTLAIYADGKFKKYSDTWDALLREADSQR